MSKKKKNVLKTIDEAWLGIEVDDDDLFNPFSFLHPSDDDFNIRLAYLLSRPEYLSFFAKHILGVNLLPSQSLILEELWIRKFPMLVGSRGFGKSFLLALYAILRAVMFPKRKIVIVGAAFRQSKVIFEYMETIWRNAPLLRDMCDSNSGPSRDPDRCVMRINDSTITCLPLGDGQKIRGQRAHDIIADEFATIPKNIFENVVAGFAVVSADPVANVKRMAAQKKAKELGYEIIAEDTPKDQQENQIILSGTAYYDFNHFAAYWKKWKEIIKSGGNKNRLREIFGGEEVPDTFDWTQYSIIRVPYELVPPGFMDADQVARSKATVHTGIYQMEYGACSRADTPIITNRGIKPIIDVEVGDLVLTHRGRFMPVAKKTYRHYVGKIAKYSTYGYNQNIFVTPDHPYWTGGDNFNDFGHIDHSLLTNLKELSGAKVMYPELMLDNILETPDGKYLYPQSSNSKICINQQRAIRAGNYSPTTIGQSAVSYVKQSRRKPKNAIPATIPLSYDFGCIIGYYVAEGNIGSNGKSVEFALDEHKDTSFQQHLLDCIVKVFGFDAKPYPKAKNTISININSRLVADLIKYICPGVSDTKLVDHDILFSNQDFMAGFITGYWNGDGHINEANWASAHCVNQSLLMQVKLCLSFFGISSSLLDGSGDSDFKLNISGTNFVSFMRRFYGTEIAQSGRQLIINDGNATVYPVKAAEYEHYDGYVYNLEVETDESYSFINSTVHNCFTRDSQGFFKRSLLETCVANDEKPILDSKGKPIIFSAMLMGDPNKKYIFGVDPASEVDNFSIVVLEVAEGYRKIVHCWTTTRTDHNDAVKRGYAAESNFYAYCARKIRDLMIRFPCIHIAIDAQGGGIAVMEALHDKDKLLPGEVPLWPIIDEDDPKPSDDEKGLHIIEPCQFARQEWVSEANHGMRKDFELQALLFPMFDAVALMMSGTEDKLKERTHDGLENCILEIEELKDELAMIQMTQTPAGRDKWDTPEYIVGTGKKSRMRKDRYSALLMANMAARVLERTPPPAVYESYGGFATMKEGSGRQKETDDIYAAAPAWMREQMKGVYDVYE